MSSTTEPTGRVSRLSGYNLLGAGLVCALSAWLLASFYVGFQASDDANYLIGALGWNSAFPYVGDSHWTLRHSITIPTALFVRAFGLNEVATSLTGVAYFIGVLVANAVFMKRQLGTAPAYLCIN